ncbi:WD40 repeat-like protein, partial [Suillus weaverae]
MTLEGHDPRTHPSGERVHDVSSICYFPDGEQMISGSSDKTARRWDLRAGKEIEEAREVCEQKVYAVGVSRDGRWVVTAGGDHYDRAGELKACEVETGIVRTIEGHSGYIESIDISADSSLLVCLSGGSTVQIWELDTGKLVFKITSCFADAIRFSQDSRKLARPYPEPKTIREFDASTLETVGVPFEGHTSTVSGLALSSDCALLASASWDVIKLW